MNTPKRPGVPKWPFLIGDLLLLAVGWWIASKSPDPFAPLPLLVLFSCVGIGAWISVVPFLTEYRGSLKITETESLQSVAEKINQLETIGQEVAHATGQWQDVQGQAEKTREAVASISERMTAEAQAFGEFMQKANDTEKQHLRLEVEKLRRLEGDGLQITVLLMDHVYALHRAAVLSRKTAVIEQITNFQRACREVTRRIGLIPFEVKPGDAYDATIHQLESPDKVPAEGAKAKVDATLATGYTYQGKALRKPLITLKQSAPKAPQTGDLFQQDPVTTQLPQDTPPSPDKAPADTLEETTAPAIATPGTPDNGPDDLEPSSLETENKPVPTP